MNNIWGIREFNEVAKVQILRGKTFKRCRVIELLAASHDSTSNTINDIKNNEKLITI